MTFLKFLWNALDKYVEGDHFWNSKSKIKKYMFIAFLITAHGLELVNTQILIHVVCK